MSLEDIDELPARMVETRDTAAFLYAEEEWTSKRYASHNNAAKNAYIAGFDAAVKQLWPIIISASNHDYSMETEEILIGLGFE